MNKIIADNLTAITNLAEYTNVTFTPGECGINLTYDIQPFGLPEHVTIEFHADETMTVTTQKYDPETGKSAGTGEYDMYGGRLVETMPSRWLGDLLSQDYDTMHDHHMRHYGHC